MSISFNVDEIFEMAEEIESNNPRHLVFVNISTSWVVRPTSKDYIFKWFREYSQKHYKVVGFADILSNEDTNYVWGTAAASYRPCSNLWIAVLQRND